MINKVLFLFVLHLVLIGCNVSKVQFLDDAAKSKDRFFLVSVSSLEKNLGDHFRYIGSDEKFHYLIYYSTGWRYGPYRYKVLLTESRAEKSLDFKTNVSFDSEGYLKIKDYVENWHP